MDAAGTVVARGAVDSGGTNLHVEPADVVLRRLMTLAAPHRDGLVGLAIGTAGIDAPADQHHFGEVFGALAPGLGLPRGAVRVCRDVEVIAATTDAPLRVCIIAGTGSSAYGVRAPGGEEAWAGGLDLPLSDWGGGAWLGEAAMVAALRQACGMRPTTRLGPAVFDRLGLRWPQEWRALKPARARLGKPELGRLARTVDALAGAGDREACRLLDRAGDELAAMVAGVLRQLRARPAEAPEVRCVGGVIQGNARVRRRFEARVRAGWPAASFGDADAALGAARLAARTIPIPARS